MERVRLLDHTHKWRELPLAFFLVDIHHFSQSTTEIIASVAQIEFRSDVDDVSLAQIRHVPSIAGILDFAKAGFAGASSVGSHEDAAGFLTLMLFGHITFTSLKKQHLETQRSRGKEVASCLFSSSFLRLLPSSVFQRFFLVHPLQHRRRHQLLLNMPLNALGQKPSQVSATAARPRLAFQAVQRSAKHFCRHGA